MASSSAEIAYEQAIRSFEAQERTLASIRGNLSVILTGAGIAAAFLGGHSGTEHGGAFWVAAMSFALIAVATAVVLFPRRFVSDFNSEDLVATYVDSDPPWDPEATYRELALHGRESFNDNKCTLELLFWVQIPALGFFAIEIVALLIAVDGN